MPQTGIKIYRECARMEDHMQQGTDMEEINHFVCHQIPTKTSQKMYMKTCIVQHLANCYQ